MGVSGTVIVIGATPVVNGTSGRVLYNNSGAAGELTTTGSGTVLVLATSPTIVTPSITTTATLTRTSIGATSTDGLIITNTTAAAAGAQQFSPRIRLTGQGWKTNATAESQTVDWSVETIPVQGAANPTSQLSFASQVNAGGYTQRGYLLSGGGMVMVLNGNIGYGFEVGGSVLAGIGRNSGIGGVNVYASAYSSEGAAVFNIGIAGIVNQGTLPINWTNSANVNTSVGLTIYRDADDVFAQRRTTNAQKFRVYNTFTTVETAGEWFAIDWITTANVCNLQAVKGSSSGTARVLTISYGGTQASPVAAISVPITSGNITFGGGITTPGGAALHTTNTALTDGAGASTGTLTNAPAAGNPTKWIGINDNGTTRYVPAW